jgi:hypothetical protein
MSLVDVPFPSPREGEPNLLVAKRGGGREEQMKGT